MNKIAVLLIEDSSSDADLIKDLLQTGHPQSTFFHSRRLSEGLTLLDENHYDLVFLDLVLPDSAGIDSVRKLSKAFPTMPIIVLAAERDEASAVQALQQGAQDYLVKGRISPDLFSRSIRYSMERKQLSQENALLIKEHARIEEEMRRMASRDALTGLPNRRLLIDMMIVAREQALRNGKKTAVLFLDLDGFKEINDTLGRGAGDVLLQGTAARLTSLVRKSDTVAHIGGDEFALILSEIIRPEHAAGIARKIMEVIRRPFLVGEHQVQVTASIGISLFPDDEEDVDALLRYANIAMHHAKELGRNTYRFYDDAITISSLERVRSETMLRRSLDAGEMRIYYQPLVDVATRRIVCAEALARWNHPEKGLLLPDDFIPSAEETGFISVLDEWVLRTVSSQLSSWLNARLPRVCAAVNLSARQFQDPALADTVSRIIRETGIPPHSLNLEISENTAMDNVDRTAARLRELTAAGVRISIDQFGTGYSSLNHIKRLPIERLKIDKSFIRHIPDDPDDRTIIRALTAFGHNMRLKVAAEGVETEDQLTFLRRTGCDEIQGYLFGKPAPAEEFEELLMKKAA